MRKIKQIQLHRLMIRVIRSLTVCSSHIRQFGRMIYGSTITDGEKFKMKLFSILILGLCMLASFSVAETGKDEIFSPYVDADGHITLPKDYYESWVFLGSWTLPDNKNTGMHIVYTQHNAVKNFRVNDGKFPDGTVIVKEIRSTTSEAMTTGPNVIHADDIVQWFVMIKDDVGRFPDNPLWGEGWGWALFNAEDPQKNIATDYKVDCMGCHVPAKQTDWIYVQGYPLLR